jgi:hypothetical protein
MILVYQIRRICNYFRTSRINKTNWGTEVTFNIYKTMVSYFFFYCRFNWSSQTQSIPYVGSDRNSQVLQVDFKTPIVVPAGVERILVEVFKGVYPIQ